MEKGFFQNGFFYDMNFSMEKENKELLIEGAKVFGIEINEKLMMAFEIYLKELLKWNQKMNLTAIRTERGIILKHFLDSLSVIPHLPPISSLLDIGSGAGFPGIPLKMVLPSMKIILIDSRLKKVDFQRHIIRTLGLKGIEAIHGRIEDRRALEKLENRFDGIISRAFADIGTLLSLGFPYLKMGGFVLAMKGKVSSNEIRGFIKEGGPQYMLKNSFSIVLPFSNFKRTIIIFEKQ